MTRSTGVGRRPPSRKTHGASFVGGRAAVEYDAWRGMKKRCLNPDHPNYRLYGARGISVCDRWLNDFSAFLADMGPRPSPAHSLDRLDNDGNYEPGNCAWRTAVHQASNRRSVHRIEFAGQTWTATQIAARTGRSRRTIARWISQGRSAAELFA